MEPDPLGQPAHDQGDVRAAQRLPLPVHGLGRSGGRGHLSLSEVAIVGAGITGLSIAFHLSEQGIDDVLLVDCGGPGSGATADAPGGIRQQWGTHVNCAMSREAVGFWRDVEARLESDRELRFTPCGYLFLARSQRALEALEANVALQAAHGIPSRVVDAREAERIAPLAEGSVLGGSFCAEDGYFDRPREVVDAFTGAVARSGVELRRAEVLQLRRDGSGWLLDLAGGDSLAARHVVVAAYDASPALVRPLGIELPIARRPRVLRLSRPLDRRVLDPLVIVPEQAFAAKQLADGRLLASRSEGDDPDGIAAVARELLPVIADVPLPSRREGFYDMTPDGQAILGALDHGLWVAAGFSGHGFMMSPVVGADTARAIAGEEPGEAFRSLSLERFAQGRPIPEPQVI